MANLGTRKFFKSFDDSTDDENNQILKNSGYISIVLHSVFYNSKGNFWQRIFKGVDKVALTSSITYYAADRSIEAKAVQDKRKVKANKNHFLALSRLVALKVPASADGLELKVGMTAVKDDNFENSLNLMNSKEFQEPLQLASIPIGQITSVTKIIKKIFTGIEENNELEATFAGIISKSKVKNPIEKERLTTGYLIMIANNEEDNIFFSEMDPKKLHVEADGVKYTNERITHTNLVYSITFEPLKGIDENSKWFTKYQQALNKLDDVTLTNKEDEQKKVLNDSRRLWIEGSALLFEDPTYIDSEQRSIKGTYFKKINERFNDLTNQTTDKFLMDFLDSRIDDLDFIPEVQDFDVKAIETESNKVAKKYLRDLGKFNLVFPE